MASTRTAAFSDPLVAAMCCAVCRAALEKDDRGLGCASGHRFDFARPGYVNLLPGKRLDRGDTDAMIRARDRFLATGAYRALDDALRALLPPVTGVIVEVGAGTAEHLATLVEASGGYGLALDISRAAATAAARRHPRIASAIADTEAFIPVRDAAAAVVLSAFAPRQIGELDRVLGDEGVLLIARAGPRHLEGTPNLRHVSVDPRKEERLAARMEGRFAEAERKEVLVPLELDRTAAADLIAMGPAAFHLQETPNLPARLVTTAHFVVSRYTRASGR